MSVATVRTLMECRKRGWRACVIEKWIPQTKRRLDAFGFGDVLVLDDMPGALLIQATTDTGGNVSARVGKIRGECAAAASAWLAAGNRVSVWGWGKRGKAGARKLWTLRVVEIAPFTCVAPVLDGPLALALVAP